MNSLLALATLIGLLLLSDGSIAIEFPGLTSPTIHRGIE